MFVFLTGDTLTVFIDRHFKASLRISFDYLNVKVYKQDCMYFYTDFS